MRPYILNYVKSKSGKKPKLQEKDVTITENGTTKIEADTGFDGLKDVDVTVSGILDTSDATATANDILSSKTAYVNGEKITGLIPVVPSGTKIQLNNPSISLHDWTDSFSNSLNVDVFIRSNTDVKYYSLNSGFKIQIPATKIKEAVNTLKAENIKKDTKILGVTGTFEGENYFGDEYRNGSYDMPGILYAITKVPNLPIWNASPKRCTNLFRNCVNLVDVPVLSLAGVDEVANMFLNCNSLSNDSLNNILKMCANDGSNIGSSAKTLAYIGLSSTQAQTCQTLSNWNAFVEAGWSTGY